MQTLHHVFTFSISKKEVHLKISSRFKSEHNKMKQNPYATLRAIINFYSLNNNKPFQCLFWQLILSAVAAYTATRQIEEKRGSTSIEQHGALGIPHCNSIQADCGQQRNKETKRYQHGVQVNVRGQAERKYHVITAHLHELKCAYQW